nr:LOW QUALITY PROTEIN: AP-4 complex accessory subunit tepsin [Pelodiscus sinensis]|eukprot:XP_025033986.1 LOW QUALITY PROTEIN: AP-4 complex accessory subunit tepsin [Pelodiscus sinensis]
MAAPLRDRLGFLSRLPTLMKGTSDDNVPCPGYLFEEIAKISHDSPGSSQCLLEHLLNRLQNNSCHVKLKVLKILLYMCTHGSARFLQQLKRNSAFIQEAAVFAGPPDPLHGNSMYQKVRAAAQDLTSALFSDTLLPLATAQPCRPLPPTGKHQPSVKMPTSPSQRSAVLPGPQLPPPRPRELQEDAYQPVTAPPPGKSRAGPGKPPAAPAHSVRGSHQAGQAGGGWEEVERGHSSQNSSQFSKWGSDGQSAASRELGAVTERVEGGCLRELSLVSTLTRGSKVFLTRDETQHFVKEGPCVPYPASCAPTCWPTSRSLRSANEAPAPWPTKPQSLSLFAGMELLPFPRPAGASPGERGCGFPVPWTPPCTGTRRGPGDAEGSQETSAFSFLNM